MKSYKERLAICESAYNAYSSVRTELEQKIQEERLRQLEIVRAQRTFKNGDKVRHIPTGKIGFVEYRTKRNSFFEDIYLKRELGVILKDIKKDGTISKRNVFDWVKRENEFELVIE